jgi:hypothetical protein
MGNKGYECFERHKRFDKIVENIKIDKFDSKFYTADANATYIENTKLLCIRMPRFW